MDQEEVSILFRRYGMVCAGVVDDYDDVQNDVNKDVLQDALDDQMADQMNQNNPII